MEDQLIIKARSLGSNYYNHKIFCILEELSAFYDFLAYNDEGDTKEQIVTSKKTLFFNIYSSIQGTFESLKLVVYTGRLNDAFALARKYADAVTTSLYLITRVDKDASKIIESSTDIKSIFSASEARRWTLNSKKLYRNTSIPNAPLCEVDAYLGDLLQLANQKNDSDSKKNNKNRQVCNDNLHYNSWSDFSNNDLNYLRQNGSSILLLDKLFDALVYFFTEHFSYLYLLKPQLYCACDYASFLGTDKELGTDAKYFAASIVKEMFNKYIKTAYPKVAEYLISKNIMDLD